LLTDFGSADYFVGAVKGAILSVNPSALIVDITHEIPPHDVDAGAFALLASYRSFPQQTIHVGVVDPGVGSSRRSILVSAGDYFFVGPDNGIFSYILENEPRHLSFHLVNEKYFHDQVSATFHGRDIFAPVAAALSLGVKMNAFGPKIIDEVRLPSLQPVVQHSGRLKGRIIHIDHFGNCITNLRRENLDEPPESRASLLVNGRTIRSFKPFFSHKKGGSEKLFCLWGSAGFLEIAAANQSAAKLLGAKRGQAVVLRIKRQ